MADEKKTKEQLLDELTRMRQRVTELEEGFRRVEDLQRLVRSEERYRALFEASTDAIFLETLEGQVLDCNAAACEIFGYTKEELIGLTVADLVPEEVAKTLPDVIDQHLKAGGIHIETSGTRKNGEIFPTEVRTRLVTTGGEKLVVVYVRDITGRRQIEQQLVHLERLHAVEELAAGISHNLNNILTGVLGPAQLLEMSTDDPKLLREVDDILTSAWRARDVVRRLNQSVRGEGEKLYSVSVAKVVEEAVRTAQPRWKDEAEAKGIAIDVVSEVGKVSPIKGTRSGLHDALLNLLLNAVDAMPEGGTITVRAREDKRGVQVQVRDTGIGMDAETRQRVFEPFFTTKRTVDVGLGLSAAYGLVKSWGGEVEVESAVGRGTCFTVHLPVWAEPEDPEGEPERQGRILVVEDDERVCHVLSRFLEREHQVEVAENGREALEGFVPGRYDVVLIDLGMPGMPGDQVARRMRDVDPSISAVLITGWELEVDDPRLQEFDFHLEKPVNLNRLQEVVDRVLAQGKKPEG